MDKISIIIPVNNTELYLQKCISSVVYQTYNNLEIICVDDGSTDKSLEILEEYTRKHSNIRIIKLLQQHGPGAARNIGIKEATGDWIGFVDSDDYVEPDMYEKLISVANDLDVDIAMCAIKKFSDDPLQKFAMGDHTKLLSQFNRKEFLVSDIIDEIFNLRFVCWNRIYKANLLRNGPNFLEGSFYEDMPFFFDAMLSAKSITFISEELYHNRRQREGATTFEQSDRVMGVVNAISVTEQKLVKYNLSNEIMERFYHFSFRKMYEHLHRIDAENLDIYYDKLKKFCMLNGLQDNIYLTEVDQDILKKLMEGDVRKFLLSEQFSTKTELAQAKRAIRFYREEARNSHMKVSDNVERKVSKKKQKASLGWLFLSAVTPNSLKNKIKKFTYRDNSESIVIKPALKKPSLKKRTALAQKPAQNAYPKASTSNQYDALDFLRLREVEILNERVLNRIRKEIDTSKRKLRVGFLVNDRSKWNGSNLIEELEKTGLVECGFICQLNHNVMKLCKERRMSEFCINREFFQDRGKIWFDLYDVENDLSRPVENINCDVVFLQQPWEMKDLPRRLIGRVLCAYMHYGFIMMANHGMHYNIASFHSYLWRYFTQTEGHRMMHIEHDPSSHGKIVVSGYPKLDVYLSAAKQRECVSIWKRSEEPYRTRVIFAPHHSLGKDNLGMSTFRWSGTLMKDLANKHHDLDWVYKPHPNLKFSVPRNGVMTADEYAAYESSWRERDNCSVYDNGDYFDLFRSADVLITDCGSFLAEFLPTGKPIIWLVSDNSIGLNRVGQALVNGFYRAHSAEECSSIFQSVVLNGLDPLKKIREANISKVFDGQQRSSLTVTQNILSSIFNAKELHQDQSRNISDQLLSFLESNMDNSPDLEIFYSKIISKQVIEFSDLRRVAISFKELDAYNIYDDLLVFYDPELSRHEVDQYKSLGFSSNTGRGKGSLNTFRKLYFSGGNKSNFLFEKVYRVDSDAYARCNWFYSNLSDICGAISPKLVNETRGSKLSVMRFEFVDVGTPNQADVLLFLKQLVHILSNHTVEKFFELPVALTKPRSMLKKLAVGFPKYLEAHDAKCNNFLPVDELKNFWVNLVFTHGDLHRKNISTKGVAFDWDSCGFAPRGDEIARCLSSTVRFENISQLKEFLCENFGGFFDNKDLFFHEVCFFSMLYYSREAVFKDVSPFVIELYEELVTCRIAGRRHLPPRDQNEP